MASKPYTNVLLHSKNYPIHLRTYNPTTEDRISIHSILSNPLNVALDRSPSKKRDLDNLPSYESISNFVDLAISSLSEPSPPRCNLVITENSTSKIIGLAGFGAIKYHDNDNDNDKDLDSGKRKRVEGNAGVMLNPEARGKGYGLEGFKMSVQWGFEYAEFDEVSVTLLERNEGMKRIMDVVEQIGWKGSLQRNVVEDGEVELHYVMLRKDWMGWKTETEAEIEKK